MDTDRLTGFATTTVLGVLSQSFSENDPVLALCAEWNDDAAAHRVCSMLLQCGARSTARCADGQCIEARALKAGNERTAGLLRTHAVVSGESACRDLLRSQSGADPPARGILLIGLPHY